MKKLTRIVAYYLCILNKIKIDGLIKKNTFFYNIMVESKRVHTLSRQILLFEIFKYCQTINLLNLFFFFFYQMMSSAVRSNNTRVSDFLYLYGDQRVF